MNYLLFANPQTGSKILTALIKVAPPKVVITQLNSIDSWKRIIYRFLLNKLTVEDKLRFLYKINFYDFRSLNVKRLKQIIDKYKIEIGFITTFANLIPKEMFELFPKGVYNIHPSLLPKHGGANPIFWIIYSEDKVTGTTCHRVTDVFDNGEIISQTNYRVKNMDSRQLFQLYVQDIKTMIPNIINNYKHFVNNVKEMGTVTYDPKEIPKIDLNDSRLNEKMKKLFKRANRTIY